PGPQIIGVLSDVFRLDSDLDVDRFNSLQKALAINWLSILLSSFFVFLSVFSYPQDAMNVRGPPRAEKGECESLIGRRKSRTASVLETSLMGRRATLESITR
ncbi:hypothetical protein PFISCL1PPCAC_26205, partial [Pristionchus fissidentatus]